MEQTNEQQNLRRVVVTGAAGALGRRAVEEFLDAGCTVIGIDRNFGPRLASHEDVHRLHTIGCDLTKTQDVRAAFDAVVAQFGGIDGLIHCAGGFRFAASHDISDSDVDFLVDLNLKSTLLATRAALGHMRSSGFGRIVLVSSATAARPGFGVGAYAATKLGLHAFMESVAAEVKELDINIVAVAPAIMDTPPNRADMPDADHTKWVQPQAVARIMLALTQPTMDPVRTCVVPITGGV